MDEDGLDSSLLSLLEVPKRCAEIKTGFQHSDAFPQYFISRVPSLCESQSSQLSSAALRCALLDVRGTPGFYYLTLGRANSLVHLWTISEYVLD